ncbi:TIGR00730 family Rossman fold protein [Kibdelosporangium philippinense]|uniref:Cytokinin riboside 5'-monophosphate phosphoribohydrolase n=1 Tax=Kibdelosporangium philippinense TaxID=211113 RepID=A0ABS8ZPC4_9PSEU|nr:TIGR00730 family Rossman fold protein [Kibdelosporangium philippinense]MCE7008486.1 TIGR00730 family Rossman fold protein [Kibdelosporangium philippinense]
MRICVFCGSAAGTKPRYAAAAAELGKLLAKRGITLVYGGASVGTMGIIADAALEAGGEVIGVIPTSMTDREIAHQGLTELHVVSTMHERKALMAELSDAFLALPGGAGTLDELFEIWTWYQIGVHSKPIGIANIDGFYDPLIAMVDHMVAEGFIRASYRDFITIETDLEKLVSGYQG